MFFFLFGNKLINVFLFYKYYYLLKKKNSLMFLTVDNVPNKKVTWISELKINK